MILDGRHAICEPGWMSIVGVMRNGTGVGGRNGLIVYLPHNGVVHRPELSPAVRSPVRAAHQLLHDQPDVKQRVPVPRWDVLRGKTKSTCSVHLI